MQLAGRLAVVTGGSRGIGAATARLLARRGAGVVLLARGEAGLRAVVGEIEAAGGRAFAHPVDLRDDAAVAACVEDIRRGAGAPDILINNAGTGQFRFVEETPVAAAREMIDVPYLAAFRMTRAFLPDMIARRCGHIVNVTSAAAYRVFPGATAYQAACYAVRGFTEALRADLHGLGIGVTLLAAGTSTTPGYAHYPGVEERVPRISRLVPLLTPERIAAAILRAVERDRRRVIHPATQRLFLWLDHWLPWLTEALVVRTGWTRLRHPPRQE
jgi:uncharacterized protein